MDTKVGAINMVAHERLGQDRKHSERNGTAERHI